MVVQNPKSTQPLLNQKRRLKLDLKQNVPPPLYLIATTVSIVVKFIGLLRKGKPLPSLPVRLLVVYGFKAGAKQQPMLDINKAPSAKKDETSRGEATAKSADPQRRIF